MDARSAPRSVPVTLFAAVGLMLAMFAAPAHAELLVRPAEGDVLNPGATIIGLCSYSKTPVPDPAPEGTVRTERYMTSTLTGPSFSASTELPDCDYDWQVETPGTYTLETLHYKEVTKVVCTQRSVQGTCLHGEFQPQQDRSFTFRSRRRFKVSADLPRKRFTDIEKQDFTRISIVQGAAAGAMALCPVCTIHAVITGLSASYWAWLAVDPPDKNFRSPVRRVVLKPPRVAPGGGISPAAASALNALNDAQMTSSAGVRALVTAVERAEGARKARNPEWERRQMLSAAGFASEAASALGREANLRKQAASALTAGGFPETALGGEQADLLQARVVAQGVPAETASLLKSLNARPADVKYVGNEILTADTGTASSFPGLLAAPSALSQLARTAARLKSFAARIKRAPLKPAP
jgi:hypothetical protein